MIASQRARSACRARESINMTLPPVWAQISGPVVSVIANDGLSGFAVFVNLVRPDSIVESALPACRRALVVIVFGVLEGNRAGTG